MTGFFRWGVLLIVGVAVGCADAGLISSPSNPASSDPSSPASLDTTGVVQLWDWNSIGIATGCDPSQSDWCDPGCYSYDAYAPPMTWGAWKYLTSYFGPGSISFSVSASPVGDTSLSSQVRYDGQTIVPFGSSITFSTPSGEAGSIYVRFKGTPYGTAVNGQICW